MQRKGQVSAEFTLIAALMLVLVATVMVSGFRNLELDTALSAVRLGGTDVLTSRPYVSLGRVDYAVFEANGTVIASPNYYQSYGSVPAGSEAAFLAAARDSSVAQLRKVFAPNATSFFSNECQNASYRLYCVKPAVTALPG